MHTHQLLEYSGWKASFPNQHFQLFSVPSLKAPAGHIGTVCSSEVEALIDPSALRELQAGALPIYLQVYQCSDRDLCHSLYNIIPSEKQKSFS